MRVSDELKGKVKKTMGKEHEKGGFVALNAKKRGVHKGFRGASSSPSPPALFATWPRPPAPLKACDFRAEVLIEDLKAKCHVMESDAQSYFEAIVA